MRSLIVVQLVILIILAGAPIGVGITEDTIKEAPSTSEARLRGHLFSPGAERGLCFVDGANGPSSVDVPFEMTQTCTEGQVEVLETCPSGQWKHRRVWTNAGWVEEARTCTQTERWIFLYVCDPVRCGLALDGGDIVGADVYWDGSHTVTGFGGYANLLVYSGTYKIRVEKSGYETREKTVTVVDQSLWITVELPKLPPCAEGTVEVLETCVDGVTWKTRRLCTNGVWVEETQPCPADNPDLQIETVCGSGNTCQIAGTLTIMIVGVFVAIGLVIRAGKRRSQPT